jgi:hypothetical protein
MVSTTTLLRRLRPGSFMWSTYQPLPGTPLGDAAVSAWPTSAEDRLDDHAPYATRTPPAVTGAEREETYRELATLQASLVEAASEGRNERGRPVDVPTPRGAPPLGLLERLGLGGPSAPLGAPGRVNAAVLQRGSISLEIEAADAAPCTVTIGPNDGSRFYRTTARLGLSYRGREAPAPVLRAIDAMAMRLADLGIEDLRRFFEEPAT